MLPKQRLYVGKFKVNFNDDENPKCEIYLNYDISPSIKLSQDGLVFYKTDRESLKFNKIACLHKATPLLSAWHHQDLVLTPVKRGSDKLEVTYFGDINIDWVFDGETTVAAASRDTQSNSAVKEGHVKSSGELKVEIKDNQTEVEKQFLKRYPEAIDKNFKIKSQILQVKKD